MRIWTSLTGMLRRKWSWKPRQPASYSPSARDRGKCVASLTAPDLRRFDEALWILDAGTNFDMCPSIKFGIRTMRHRLGCLVSATGPAFLDYTFTIFIDAFQEERHGRWTLREAFGCRKTMSTIWLQLLLGAFCGKTVLEYA